MLKKHGNINLLINYYNSDNEKRQTELIQALRINLNIPYISVHLLIGENIELPKLALEMAEIIRYSSDYLTFQQFFEYANTLQNDSIATIINADIACDKTIYKLEKYVTEKVCVCLGRWDKIDGQWKLTRKNDTQDLWSLKVPIIKDLIKRANFYLGVPGCDNHIAYILNKNYKLKNPSKIIKIKHFHSSGVRNRCIGKRVKGKIRRVNIE